MVDGGGGYLYDSGMRDCTHSVGVNEKHQCDAL